VKQSGYFALTLSMYLTRLGRLPKRAVSQGANSRSIASSRLVHERRVTDYRPGEALGTRSNGSVATASWPADQLSPGQKARDPRRAQPGAGHV
jgi:hypothetical protein